MRLRAWLWLALSSFSGGWLWGAPRPHYGGALTLDLAGSFTTLEPLELPDMLSPLIGQTLTRINAHGEPEPWLAVSWQREVEGKRWRFSLRNKVVFHDGAPFDAANAAPVLLNALKKAYGDVAVMAGGQTIVIQADRPLPELPTALASARFAIVRKNEANAPIGTGPFRVANWEPGRRLTLQAFEDNWGGRPYLDSVVVNLGSSRSTADVFEIPFASPRRIVPESTRIWTSAPRELLALVAANDAPATIVQALGFVVDRTPIVNALAQRQGQAAFGLLPQWLSGYEFLFQTPADPAHARQLVSQIKLGPIALGYPAGDSFARAVADRLALNARDAGLSIQTAPNANAPLHLVRWTIESTDAAAELARLAQFLGMPERANTLDASKPENLYEAEQALLENNRVVPVIHLPLVLGLASRVHFKDQSTNNKLIPHFEDCWVDP